MCQERRPSNSASQKTFKKETIAPYFDIKESVKPQKPIKSLEDIVDEVMNAKIDPRYQRAIDALDKRRNLTKKA